MGNATPVLITKSGRLHKDPLGEWLEVDVDIRCWSYAARHALLNLRDCLPLARMQVGFLIQGCEDDDLPEGMVGVFRIHNLDLLNSPVSITDPRTVKPAMARGP